MRAQDRQLREEGAEEAVEAAQVPEKVGEGHRRLVHEPQDQAQVPEIVRPLRLSAHQERREYRVSAPSTQRGLVFGYGMDGWLGVTTPEEGASDRGGDRPLRLVYSGCDASR